MNNLTGSNPASLPVSTAVNNLKMQALSTGQPQNAAAEAEQKDSVILSPQGVKAAEAAQEVSVRPELKAGTMAAIRAIHDVQQQGGGTIPLETFVKSFGIELSDKDKAALKQRGGLKLDANGNFSNTGQKLKLNMDGGLKLTIPEKISGSYKSSADGFDFKFNPKETLEAGKFVFSVKMEGISASQKGIFIDMAGKNYDQDIRFQ